MAALDRLPAIPLIVNDPFFSVWMPADTLTAGETIHWSGAPMPLTGTLTVDGTEYAWLGHSSHAEMQTIELQVTPTATISTLQASGVQLTVSFWAPALPDDLDALSTPVTLLDYEVQSVDGMPHEIVFRVQASSALCYNGRTRPPMIFDTYQRDGLSVSYVGQQEQHILGQSGDHVTIDWGYLYLAGSGTTRCSESSVQYEDTLQAESTPAGSFVMFGYDDIASINYFGVPCRAWYMRNGMTLPDALCSFAARHDTLKAECEALDRSIINEAIKIGGEDYALIACASWRHVFGAHKLIATPEGEMALLSKENDSNGCIGTVDVSYPSVPLFLRFCPELVNALCRPVLAFASLPVWEEDFAPHDVGRYPHATGQVYASKRGQPDGAVYPPYFTYPAGCGIYDLRYQMPVEECGNMLVMLEAAVSFGASDKLIKRYAPMLEKWVHYLDRYGDDPGEQLCTDDFAGHLARNVNLSAKAIVGIACYARMIAKLGKFDEAIRWQARAHAMADDWLKRSDTPDGTALTYDGSCWSMKYNLCWDLVLDLGLLPTEFYRKETESYLPRINEFGLPLDNRADYTKSDWIIWTASMAQSPDCFRKLIAPVAHYLRTTTSRVPFSDWYDTKTGRYVHFIGRSVQGGVYMPMLMKF